MTSKYPATAAEFGTFAAATGSGMLALWDPDGFGHIVDYESWEPELLDDEPTVAHIRAGRLVPLNLDSDGRFGVLVRVDTVAAPTLTERERRYLLHSSDPYLFRSSGTARVSGIEDIGNFPETYATSTDPLVSTLELPAGPFAVTIHLLDWEAEPGSLDDQRTATPAALPDFVVLVGPATRDTYRSRIETFDEY